MNDNEALKATTELVVTILLKCKEYADKDGLDFKYVVKVTAEEMLTAICQK